MIVAVSMSCDCVTIYHGFLGRSAEQLSLHGLILRNLGSLQMQLSLHSIEQEQLQERLIRHVALVRQCLELVQQRFVQP